MGHPAQDASTAAQAAQGLQRGVCDKAGTAVSTLPQCPPASSTLAADRQPKWSYAENLVDQNVKLLTQWLLLSKALRTPVRAEPGDINLFGWSMYKPFNFIV